MGKFTFRLEALLNIANHREEEAQKQLALCLEDLKNCQEQLFSLAEQHTKALRALVNDKQGKLSIHKLICNHQFCQYLKEEVEKKQREVILAEKQVEKARENLQEAIKKRKILERLKENQYSNFIFEEEKNLQKEIDEIANNLFFSSAGGF
ncbi:MAG: flagellar export protein FliJ [Clostridia bacterium]|nr:flagellar export protein FliJ [Clostridia bacterium]